MFSRVHRQSGPWLQARLGLCVQVSYTFVLFFPGVAVQTEAREPGCSCQVPQLYFWTGEELCGAQKGKWSSKLLLWGTWLGSTICLAWKGWCQGCPVAGGETRWVLNTDVELFVRLPRVAQAGVWKAIETMLRTGSVCDDAFRKCVLLLDAFGSLSVDAEVLEMHPAIS